MPNPVRLSWAGTTVRVNSTKNASWPQRVTITKVGDSSPSALYELPRDEFIMTNGPGDFDVLHETKVNGAGPWVRGQGRNGSGSSRVAEFDDSPNATGDEDFNDTVITFMNP